MFRLLLTVSLTFFLDFAILPTFLYFCPRFPGFGERSWRYSMVVNDMKIEKIFIEVCKFGFIVFVGGFIC